MRLVSWLDKTTLDIAEIEVAINLNPSTVDYYRVGTTGDGFTTEVGDYTKIGTLTARIEKANSAYREILADLGASILNSYIGITTTKNVLKNDEWQVSGVKYIVKEFTDFGSHIETILEII